MKRRSVGVFIVLLAVMVATAFATQGQVPADTSTAPTGVREAAWSPDSKRIAVTWFDAIWTMTPEGRDAKRVIARPDGWVSERDAAWSPDGKSIAFAANTRGQFDVWIAPAGGGAARRLTSMTGDERWPSWTRDGRIVFSRREPGRDWALYVVAADGTSAVARISPSDAGEWQGRVSPDGKRIAFISDRDPDATSDADVWVRPLPAPGDAAAAAAPAAATRVTRGAGIESFPAWAPDNARVAYAASRGAASGVWVSVVSDASATAAAPAGQGRGAAGGGRGAAGGVAGRGGRGGAAELDAPVLASRKYGAPAWSPDRATLLVATLPNAAATYNGNPNRNDDDPPIAFGDADDYAIWRIAAPRAVDEGAATIDLPAPDQARWTAAFDQVWQTLKSLYYSTGDSAAAWDAIGAKYRPQLANVRDLAGTETVIDRMIAEQPLIKPAVESSKGVAASGHPLASAAGARILERGGNVVDAGIAVAFALGVVEPDASGLGGDGQAILFLKGMSEPVVIEYKDMTPSRAVSDNPRLFTSTGARTAADGPSVANIPGIVAGLDLLYKRYGSKKVEWADLVAPAITLADEGFILDESLPTTIAEGRASFAKYPEAAKIFLPGGRIPKAGDRFVNKDYAETLRTLAKEGGRSFYDGSIARKIAADMAENGGVITFEDLTQYRAIERKPLAGRYHGHLVYSVPPPVSNGLQMVETLQILDNYVPKRGATYTTDADYFHYAIEAWRVRDGGARIADPERYQVDLGNHLEPGHALDRFKLINPAKVYVATGGGGRGGLPPSPGADPIAPYDNAPDAAGFYSTGGPAPRTIQTGTTSFVVADAEGNMIAFTQTLSTWGGNFYVSKGLGFLYNDHFRGGGGRGGGFGSTLPLMRSSTTSVPTLVFAPQSVDPGRYGIPGFSPLLAVGCAGNAWIPASVYDVILNVVDGGMTAQQAIEAPRFLIGAGDGGRPRTQIEDRFPRSILADLEARGHSFTKVGRKGEVKYGYVSVAVVNAAKGTVSGGAEPRRSHGTVAAK